MSDIELVIKIDEEDYENIKETGFNNNDQRNRIVEAIANGVPLPTGHGRLIDADAFERRCMFDSDIEDMQDVIYALRDYKSIIEADKAESEE